jgi:hypothetical protein
VTAEQAFAVGWHLWLQPCSLWIDRGQHLRTYITKPTACRALSLRPRGPVIVRAKPERNNNKYGKRQFNDTPLCSESCHAQLSDHLHPWTIASPRPAAGLIGPVFYRSGGLLASAATSFVMDPLGPEVKQRRFMGSQKSR